MCWLLPLVFDGESVLSASEFINALKMSDRDLLDSVFLFSQVVKKVL